VAPLLPAAGASFKNPFDGSVGADAAWEDRATLAAAPTATAGLTSYSDDAGGQTTYNLKGRGKSAALTLVLTAGQ
jgi:hypothetical protein